MITMSIRQEGRLIRAFEQLPSEFEKEGHIWLDKNVRVLISSSGNTPGLVQVTPPFHKNVEGKAAQRHGQAKVASDIKRVFAKASYAFQMIAAKSPIMAEVFWRHLKRREFDKAQIVLQKYSSNVRINNAVVVSAPDESLHEKMRKSNTGTVSKNQRALQIIANEGRLNSYIRKRQSRVGYLMSSIPTAAGSQFGKINGIPNWASKQRSRLGYAKTRKSGKIKSITLGIMSKAYGMQRRFDEVLKYRESAMLRELNNGALLKAFERKIRARTA